MIPSELWQQKPILAVTGNRQGTPLTADQLIQVLDVTKDRSYSLKLDGVRCLAYCDEGTVVLRSRTGVDITVRFPDVAMTLAVLYRTGTAVFDGEIVVFDTDGRPDFELVMKRFGQHSAFRANRLAPAAPAPPSSPSTCSSATGKTCGACRCSSAGPGSPVTESTSSTPAIT